MVEDRFSSCHVFATAKIDFPLKRYSSLSAMLGRKGRVTKKWVKLWEENTKVGCLKSGGGEAAAE